MTTYRALCPSACFWNPAVDLVGGTACLPQTQAYFHRILARILQREERGGEGDGEVPVPSSSVPAPPAGTAPAPVPAPDAPVAGDVAAPPTDVPAALDPSANQGAVP